MLRAVNVLAIERGQNLGFSLEGHSSDQDRRKRLPADPGLDVIRVYRQAGAGFARAVELSADAGDMLATPLLPGLDIPLARVFKAQPASA